jgi:hypothetical protein
MRKRNVFYITFVIRKLRLVRHASCLMYAAQAQSNNLLRAALKKAIDV